MKKKKIGIVTITSGLNLGNSLQNYALQKFLLDLNCIPYTIIDKSYCFLKKFSWIAFFRVDGLKKFIKLLINYRGFRNKLKILLRKQECYLKFNNNINFADSFFINDKVFFRNNETFDYFIAGSDQIWNPNFKISKTRFLRFTPKEKRISYAASLGVSTISEKAEDLFEENLKEFKAISVREKVGANILKNILNRDISVLVDPTLLLEKEKWILIEKKPTWKVFEKYILIYFLGEIGKDIKEYINSISSLYNLKIINILDENNTDYYNVGPSEFIYLIRNAKLMFTDSFHGTVFSILMNTPFLVISREQKDMPDMTSRIDTLLELFDYQDRYITNGKFSLFDKKIFHMDFSNVKSIQEREKKRSKDFLEKAMNLKIDKE